MTSSISPSVSKEETYVKANELKPYLYIQVRCLFCPKIFCCIDCRQLHEKKTHSLDKEDFIVKFCFICSGKPFPLKKDISEQLLQHISEKHLPLLCRKCNKVTQI